MAGRIKEPMQWREKTKPIGCPLSPQAGHGMLTHTCTHKINITKSQELGVVAHVCNPSALRGRGSRSLLSSRTTKAT